MTIEEFENFCKETDHIRVVVRAPHNAIVPGFGRKKAVNKSKKISAYWKDVKSVVGDYEFVIIDGRGELPHGNNQVATVRDTYKDD